METFKIISDSSCDLTLETLKKLEIDLIPLSASFDGVNYQKDLVELTKEKFYETLSTQNVFPKTTLPSIQEYIDIFKKNIAEGHNNIICLCLSSALSGAYQAALSAKDILADEIPKCKIAVIDSANACAGFGLMVNEIVKMRDDGLSIDEAVTMIEEIKKNSKVIFSVDSLEYLVKGGRISKSAAFVGELLNIKPIVTVDNGKLVATGKVRGKKKAMSEMIEFILKETKENKNNFVYASIYGTVKEDAIAMQTVLENEHNYKFEIEAFQVGAVIGSHTGPTAIGLAYFPKYR